MNCFITVQCRNLQLVVANNSKPSVMYSDIHLIEGTMVNFSCPPGLVVNGTMSAACARNGEWEPDPQDVKCIEGWSMHVHMCMVYLLSVNYIIIISNIL